MKQPYSYWLKVPGSVGLDRKESPESNLHVCGENDTKIAIYNMEERIKENQIKQTIGALAKGDCWWYLHQTILE